ncbi:hypothetical protein AGMMS50268_28020 [Spirochaetia bacterium]|nr:hypothetical protein AGMMS50268_28020 [Spirochaetia bacterium]
MEKPGMDRRRPPYRSGLLIPGLFLPLVLGLCLSAPSLGAQDFGGQDQNGQSPGERRAPGPLRALVQSSPEAPQPGALWTVTILVDHPLPSEVQVRLPSLPPSLSLELMRSEPRLIRKPAGEAEGIAAVQGITERWTAVEFQFSLRGTGRIVLEPFEVTIPGASVLTSPLVLTVRGASAEFRPRLSWQNPPAVLMAGKSTELALFLSGWDPRRPLPESRLLLPETPPGAILEPVSGSPPETDGAGVILRLNVIPLGGDLFTLPQTPVTLGEFSLVVPALRIPVTAGGTGAASAGPSPKPAGAATGTASLVPVPAAAAIGAIPFPDIHPRAFPPFRSACEGIRERAEALWTADRRAEALAELRRNERDHPAGPALVPLRREAERLLALEQARGEDEKWRPPFLLAAGLLLSLGLLVLTLIGPSFRKKNPANAPSAVTTHFSRGYKGILILLAINGGICLWGLVGSAGPLLPGSARYALVRETAARRIPQDDGAINARFKEGERVLIRRSSSRGESPSGRLNWAYAESSGSTGSGWVRTEDIIFY